MNPFAVLWAIGDSIVKALSIVNTNLDSLETLSKCGNDHAKAYRSEFLKSLDKPEDNDSAI